MDDSVTFEFRDIKEIRQEILAYNLETVIADKFETIISRNVDTTRARDFYDIYDVEEAYAFCINKNFNI